MEKIMAAALGEVPFDLVLRNAKFVNVFTEEVYPAEIGVANGRVAHVTEPGGSGLEGKLVHDCRGGFVVPGLIDTHVHIESSMMTPANFARVVVPKGTTAVLADPHEICNVLGMDGMEFCFRAGCGIYLRVFWAVPSCVPSVVGMESNKMAFNAPEIAVMLADPGALTLGEVMDYMGVVNRDARMMDILRAARKSGKLIQGHVIDVTPRQLSAYQLSGVGSDHESRTLEDAIMKLRAGMVLECRYGSNAQNLPMEIKALESLKYPVNATMCTDDREVDDLLNKGHMDEAVRQAIRAGAPPVKAIQMATRNAALFMGVGDIGSLRPGCWADMVVVDDLEEFAAREVFVAGELCAEGGRMTAEIPEPDTGGFGVDTMNVGRSMEREDFLIPAEGDEAELNVLSFKDGDPFETKVKQMVFGVRDGVVDVGARKGVVSMAVIERHNATGNIGLAPAENIGLERGAVAGTVAHDSHNLFVFGKNVEDMAAAANRLIEAGGGFVAVEGGEVKAEVLLPVCGLLSEKGAGELSGEMAVLKKVVNGMGIAGEAPVHMLTWFSLAVLPEARLTDCGLIDTVRQCAISRFA